MDVILAGARPTRRAPAEYFTGTVLQDPIIAAEMPARLVSTRVCFEPGARTNWHSHPLGQTLYVIAGVGRVDIGQLELARISNAVALDEFCNLHGTQIPGIAAAAAGKPNLSPV